MKITVSTIFDVYKSDDELEEWEVHEDRNERQICCDIFHQDGDDAWNDFKYYSEILNDIKEETKELKEGPYGYYAEIECHMVEQCTMDGTEYDWEFEIITLRIEFLGELYGKQNRP